MSRLLVFTFDSPTQAQEARSMLRDLEKRNVVGLDDVLVLVKDAGGKIQRQRDLSRAVLIGAIVGALFGLPFIFLFPVISVIFGAAAGALIGRLLIDQRVEEEFIVDAERALRPNTSALLILIRTGDLAELGGALRTFPLHIYQTSLAPDLEAMLRRAYEEGRNSTA